MVGGSRKAGEKGRLFTPYQSSHFINDSFVSTEFDSVGWMPCLPSLQHVKQQVEEKAIH